ncbi:MAG: hypothetical protein HZC55_16785 [Verrucomicrobia bacterium]|nr:hypothetical protein [Verrucomicrobiota bacterium]
MTVALIDNGSLEPAAHQHLREVASRLSNRLRVPVHAVSWKHSDRIPAAELGGRPAWTVDAFLRSRIAAGERDFLLVPFFLSAQGAIGSALRRELEHLQAEAGGFTFAFTEGIAARGVVPAIAASRIRDVLTQRRLSAAPIVVVDHGGPSPASAALRDRLAGEIAATLSLPDTRVVAASMEGRHPPLLRDTLRQPGLAGQDVVVLPLFLSPGRHAGPGGDIATLCQESPARCHLAGLLGTHELAVEALAGALLHHLSQSHTPSLA